MGALAKILFIIDCRGAMWGAVREALRLEKSMNEAENKSEAAIT